MIDGLMPYPKYKDSGARWLGQVPEGWELARLKTRVLNVVDQTSDAQVGEQYVALENVQSGTGRFINRQENARFESQVKRFRAGDILFGKLRPYLAKVAKPNFSGVCVGEFLVLRSLEDTRSDYLQHLLLSEGIIDVVNSSTFGAKMPRADWSFIGALLGCFPPEEDQLAIVRFLDHAERRIRRYIAAKGKLINLLEEEKQAIIHRAVTRGLDPKVRLKPSGIDWLGDIPEHWEVVRSRRLFSPRTELARQGDVQLSATQAYGVIPQDEFEEKVGRRVVKLTMHFDKRKHVEKDDFVISMRSFQGGLERAWSSGAIRSSYVVLKGSNLADTDFFAYLFKSRGYILALQSTGNFIRDGQDLNFSNFDRVELPFVALTEQANISKGIGQRVKAIDISVGHVKSEIDLLAEYRTRLISDVVTGRLDVREAAAALPDELDDAPLEDEADDEALAADEDTADTVEEYEA